MNTASPNDVPFPNPQQAIQRLTGFENTPFVAQNTGPGLNQVLGDRVNAGLSTQINVTQIKADIVALYFSAHWCPPCRQFTPLLVGLYHLACSSNKSFEIVFASNDRSAEDFQQYYSQMPWKAIPYSERSRVQSLMTIFGIKGIPSIVVLDKHGNILQAADVTTQIRRSSELFVTRLPAKINATDSNVEALEGSSIPPQDPAVLELSVDDVLEEFTENQSLTTEQRLQGLQILKTLLGNIAGDLNNPKYRRVKKDNRLVSEKVLKHPIFVKMLKVAGFRETSVSFVAPLELDLPPSFKQTRDYIDLLIESLEQASPIGKGVATSPGSESTPK